MNRLIKFNCFSDLLYYIILRCKYYQQPRYLIRNKPTCLHYPHNIVRDERKNAQRGGYHRHGLIWELCLSTDKNKEVIIQIMYGDPSPDGGLWIMGKKDREICIMLYV